jgi:outer membrane protein TolC
VPLVTARLALLASQMTALLGRAPSPSTAMVPEDRRLPELPPAVPAGGPRDLVKTSPEVRGAEARVAEAEHRLDVNRASSLPVVSLFGAAGWQTYNFQQPMTFDDKSAFATWSFGVRLTWPIFDGGQRLTEAQQLTLTIRRRSMLYEQVFLDVVRSVQDAQIQEAKQADNVRTLGAEVELGRKVLTEARQLFEQGLSDYLSVLTALGNLSDLQRALIAAQRTLLFHRIQLYRALGGTWSQAIVDIED